MTGCRTAKPGWSVGRFALADDVECRSAAERLGQSFVVLDPVAVETAHQKSPGREKQVIQGAVQAAGVGSNEVLNAGTVFTVVKGNATGPKLADINVALVVPCLPVGATEVRNEHIDKITREGVEPRHRSTTAEIADVQQSVAEIDFCRPRPVIPTRKDPHKFSVRSVKLQDVVRAARISKLPGAGLRCAREFGDEAARERVNY